MKEKAKILTLLFVILLMVSNAKGEIIFVDDDANGANDGSSWADAYNDLQDGLAVAESGDEIRVAQGIYKPDQGAGITPGDPTATFQLKNGVAIKGGYAGFSEPNPDDRDITAYETILSGDLAGNDSEVVDPRDFHEHQSWVENSWHLVTGSGTDATAVLDGFTITGGYALGPSYGGYYLGGGMYNYTGSPTVRNCLFRGNRANIGGGMCNTWHSNPTLSNCRFISNSAHWSRGGGMYIGESNPTLKNCLFSGNWAGTRGGGIYCDGPLPPPPELNGSPAENDLTVTNCTFISNSADSSGEMLNFRSYPTLTNCVFSGNSAKYEGGGIFYSQTSTTMTNCTFAGNAAPNGNTLACDSYVHSYPSNVELTNCILWDGAYEIYNRDDSTINITYSDVQGGWTGEGNIDADPCFVEPGYWDTNGVWVGGDYHLLSDSPCIDAGDPAYVAEPNETDLDGKPRVMGGRIDMGTFEYQPRIIYVDDDATGSNDGSSWSDAFNDLQDAIDFALPGDEIRVAQGIYKPAPPGAPPTPYPPVPPEPPIPPSPPPPPPPPPNSSNSQRAEVIFADREATFMLKNGVAIKGSYAGADEPDPNARNIELYETILSGDLNGNDADENDPLYLLVDPCRAENSYHVVTGSGTDESAVLDGFTITAGNANGSWSDRTNIGGGMFNVSGSPTITNCTFTKNLARDGGGMCNYDYSNPMLTNCTFRANLTDRDGGGMYNGRSSPTLTDCAFRGNSAGWGGGGISNWFYSGPILSNCTFSENSAGAGGGFFCEYAPPPPVAGIANGRIGENPDTPVFYNSGGANITMANCDTIGNSHGDNAGGMYNDLSNPMLTNCTFNTNSAGTGGGIYSSYGSPTLLNCAFSGNSAKYDGGGMANRSSNPTLTNCTFSGNSADSGGGMGNAGGGLHNGWSSPTLTNCIIAGNLARSHGGGISCSKSNPTLTNCTFAGNFAPNGTALACDAWTHWWASNVKLTNCILWDEGDEIWNNDESVIAITYSDVQGGWPGEDNIAADPCFVELGYWDAYGEWFDGDYHLLLDSPCINAGDPNHPYDPNETDLDGKPRVIGGRIDMGAYEYRPLIPAEARIIPRTINLASKGNWFTCYIRLPEGYDVVDIDPNSVFLEQHIKSKQLSVDEQRQVAIARFNREGLRGIIIAGEVELTITGRLTDGTMFEATDVIRVIDKRGE